MSRRKKNSRRLLEEEESQERWVISYADFITLLFAFFVTLYAVSTMNEGKYKIVADSLGLAFMDIPPLSYPVRMTHVAVNEPHADKAPTGQHGYGALTAHFLTRPTYFDMPKSVRKKLGEMESNGLMEVEDTKEWLEISLKSSVLFSSGSAVLLPEANETLLPLVDIFKKVSLPIQVEGFTDSIPIYNEAYPSNWELSAARAAAVVRRFINLKLPADQFVVVGYGANFPIASNKTQVGRELNRRVVMVISKNQRIQRLSRNSFTEKEVELTQQQKQEQLIKNQPKTLEKFRLPDGRLRYTTLPERKSGSIQNEQTQTE